MEALEKVELVREKCGVSYEDAKAALDATAGDVLDAIIWLERAGKAEPRTASHSTGTPSSAAVSPEMAAAQSAYRESSRESDFSRQARGLWETLKELLGKSVHNQFVVTHKGVEVAVMPLIVPILGLFLAGATIWVLVIGLFFGLRYRVRGIGKVTFDVNGAMDRAAEAAETIKRDVTSND